ncbi:hypothetical protein AMTRI_Chr04g246100 [Amborella trichopoda]
MKGSFLSCYSCIQIFIHSRDLGSPRGPSRLLSSRESMHPLLVYGQLSLEQRLRRRTMRSPFSFWGDGGIIPFELFFFFMFFLEV